MNNETFLIAAYLIIWGGIFAYLFFCNGQQHKLARRIQLLEELVSEARSKNE